MGTTARSQWWNMIRTVGFAFLMLVIFLGGECLLLEQSTLKQQMAYLRSSLFVSQQGISANQCEGTAELHCDGLLGEDAARRPVRYVCDHERCVFECK